MTALPILSVAIRREQDILFVRQRAREVSQFLGFPVGDTTRITTALSEVARNALEYAGGGTAVFAVETTPHDRELVIRVVDQGEGIPDVEAVLAPTYESRTGMGIGIKGSRALMDRFAIATEPGQGTTVTMAKRLPASAAKFGAAEVARLAEQLAKASQATPLGELQLQNQALLSTLGELSRRQAENERLTVLMTAARDRAEEAQLVAERSMVVRQRFMSLTTHELRSPLNAIIGYLELLDMELAPSLTEKQAGHFGRLQRASKHLLGITNDFLDMAQGDAGRLTVARLPGAARHVMSEAAALVAPQAAARDVTVNLSESTDHVMYLGDSARVRQVLTNMLGNAVSFSPKGQKVDVVASRVEEPPAGTELHGGPWCAIRVTDSGPGIPPDKLTHVFEPFVQLSSDGQSSRKGSGLGLTVSRQLAVLMGGDLTAESDGEGTGATFTLWLPEGSTPAPTP